MTAPLQPAGGGAPAAAAAPAAGGAAAAAEEKKEEKVEEEEDEVRALGWLPLWACGREVTGQRTAAGSSTWTLWHMVVDSSTIQADYRSTRPAYLAAWPSSTAVEATPDLF